MHNCDDQSLLHNFFCSSNIMIFHIFSCILHLLWIYNELTMWPAPSWLDSSVGRALHLYRRDHGFEYHSRLKSFQALIHNCLSCVCNCDDQSLLHIFLCSSNIDLSYIRLQCIIWYNLIVHKWDICNTRQFRRILLLLCCFLLIAYKQLWKFSTVPYNSKEHCICHRNPQPLFTR